MGLFPMCITYTHISLISLPLSADQREGEEEEGRKKKRRRRGEREGSLESSSSHPRLLPSLEEGKKPLCYIAFSYVYIYMCCWVIVRVWVWGCLGWVRRLLWVPFVCYCELEAQYWGLRVLGKDPPLLRVSFENFSLKIPSFYSLFSSHFHVLSSYWTPL